MFNMKGQNVKELGYKIYSIKELGRTIQAPIQQLNKWCQPISLKHVVSILS